MKSKQTKPKYATYGKLVDELAKFDQEDPACVIASTDLGSPDEGENFVDGSGVKSAGVGNGDPTDHDSLKGDTIRTFSGLAQAIVRRTPGVEPELAWTVECEVEQKVAVRALR